MSSFAIALECYRRGDFAAARAALGGVLAQNPRDPQALQLAAATEIALGEPANAISFLDRAIIAAPGDLGARFNRAALSAELGRHDTAIADYAAVLAAQPRDVEARAGRAASLAALGRYGEALADYDLAIAAGVHAVYAARGAALAALGRYEEALAACDQALARNPDDVAALFNRGAALLALKRYNEAARALDAALMRDPNHVAARAVRSSVRAALGETDGAVADIDVALVRAPDRADYWMRKGFALFTANRDPDAVVCFDRAFALQPDNAEAAWSIASALLAEGDFARGLPFYEARLRLPGVHPRTLSAALRWTGAEEVAGKRVLVIGEQGFGDLFQFARYLPLLAARGAEVILAERPPALALLRGVEGVPRALSHAEPAPEADFQIPLLSLMQAFGTRLDTIPAAIPYLHADLARVAHWRAELGAASRRRIGVCWRGEMRELVQAWRALDRPALEDLLSIDADLVSLQFDPGDEAALLAAQGVRDLGAQIADFAEAAAVIDTLDLVITVDTAIAHLAGALGKEVWVLMPFHADWRWLRDRADTPWYPRMRLFRQKSFGDWAGVMAEIRAALQR